jgi:D-amino-acid dehydrogenase
MSDKRVETVLVVGAGIVGVSTAYALQKAGLKVTLIDRVGPCAGTSYGNAGAVVGGNVPSAMPGLWKTVPSMLLDPTGPLTIRWSYLFKIMPWLIRFMRETQAERVTHNAKALKVLSDTAVADWLDLMEETKLNHLIKDVGWLKVYESDACFHETRAARDLMAQQGTPVDVLNVAELRDLEPHLSHIFKHAIYHSKSRFLLNPEKIVHGIADAFKQAGGEIVISEIHTLHQGNGAISAIGNSGSYKADKLVLCTGAWSRNLAKQVGAKVPLDTERGYHMMLPVIEDKGIERPTVYGEKSFVLAPMERGIRLTSQVEFAGLEQGPDFRRVRKLLPYAKKMLPSLKTEEQDVWLGYRPSLPDSLPVIGPSPDNPDVIFAFGHQHLGMTLGPATAQHVTNLVMGRPSSIEMWPYRANRFS